MSSLNPENIPINLIKLTPIMEKWGIADDFEREKALKDATYAALIELVHSIDEISDDDLYTWLSGAESYNLKPSKEYIALTALTMAIDSAKLKLKTL